MRIAEVLLGHLPGGPDSLSFLQLELVKHGLSVANSNRLLLRCEASQGRVNEVGNWHSGVKVRTPAGLSVMQFRYKKNRATCQY